MSYGLLNNPAVASNGPSLEEWDKQVFSGWAHKTPSDIMADITALLNLAPAPLPAPPVFAWGEADYEMKRMVLDCMFTRHYYRIQGL